MNYIFICLGVLFYLLAIIMCVIIVSWPESRYMRYRVGLTIAYCAAGFVTMLIGLNL